MDNTQILEDILAFIKNQVQSGKADYYLSIVNSPTESHKRLKQATQIVDNWEKKPSHANPNEYTLHDIIDLVILYEYARNAGNGDVFVDAVTADMDLIKKGPVFQQYSQMFAKNDPNKPKSAVATPKTTPNPRKIPNNHGSTPTRPVHNLEELRKLADEQFLKELSELLKNAKPDTFTYYTFNEGLQDASKKDNYQIMLETLNSEKHKSLYEHPSLYATDDIIQLVLEYLAAVDIGQGTRYALAIQQDISSIKKAGCLRELLKDIQPQRKVSPQQLNPQTWSTTPRRINTAAQNLAQSSIMYYYSIGDLHGRLAPLQQAVTYLDETHGNNYKLVVLGDCIDRGPDGLKILKYLITLGDKVELNMGNHEHKMKDIFDFLRTANTLPGQNTNWPEVINDFKFLCLYSLRQDGIDISQHKPWLTEHLSSFDSKEYPMELLNSLSQWIETRNGGKETALRITGQLQEARPIPTEDIITPEELKAILEYIDKASSLIAINNVQNPKTPKKTKSVLLSHAAPGTDLVQLTSLKRAGAGLHKTQRGNGEKSIIDIRAEKFDKGIQDLIQPAAYAGFDEFIRGHEPVQDNPQKVKSETVKCANGQSIVCTCLDGGFNAFSRNRSTRANLYCINTGAVRQYDLTGQYVGTLDLDGYEGR